MIASDELRSALGVDEPGFADAFVSRCLRGRTDEETLAAYRALDTQCAAGGDPREGARCVIAACLQDPEFTYRLELGVESDDDGTEALTGVERASRLSFLLTRRAPAPDLVDAARAGLLDTPEGVVDAARDLMQGPGAVDVVRAFHDGWLGLDTLEPGITRDATRFPDLGADAGPAMREEMLRFVDSVVTRGGGLRELLLDTTAIVDRTTAPIYGVDAPLEDGELLEVALPEDERAGILTRLAFATLTSDERSTSPILRGAWVARNLQCIEIEPPRDGVPPLPAADADTPMTMRQRVAAHTETGVCASCHVPTVNPPGFALEHYDAIGRFVVAEWNGLAIDSSTVVRVSGEPVAVEDGIELSRALAESPETYECYVRAWMQYLYGRKVTSGDHALARFLGEQMLEGSLDVRALIDELLASDGFLLRSRELLEDLEPESGGT